MPAEELTPFVTGEEWKREHEASGRAPTMSITLTLPIGDSKKDLEAAPQGR